MEAIMAASIIYLWRDDTKEYIIEIGIRIKNEERE
jgi:hypothetical protein